jgi:hypothetical protein
VDAIKTSTLKDHHLDIKEAHHAPQMIQSIGGIEMEQEINLKQERDKMSK